MRKISIIAVLVAASCTLVACGSGGTDVASNATQSAVSVIIDPLKVEPGVFLEVEVGEEFSVPFEGAWTDGSGLTVTATNSDVAVLTKRGVSVVEREATYVAKERGTIRIAIGEVSAEGVVGDWTVYRVLVN